MSPVVLAMSCSTEGSEPENGEACIGEGGAEGSARRQQRAPTARTKCPPEQRHVAIDGRDDGDGMAKTPARVVRVETVADDDGDGDETMLAWCHRRRICAPTATSTSRTSLAQCARWRWRTTREASPLRAAAMAVPPAPCTASTPRDHSTTTFRSSAGCCIEATDAGLDAVSGMPA